MNFYSRFQRREGQVGLFMGAAEYRNREVETANRQQIRSIQEAKLVRQLDYLFARSRFYQEKFRAAGISRNHVRSLEDLQRFPFTTKEELRASQAECPPLGKHIAADLDDVIRVHSSTGTTGKPSFVGLTRNDARIWTEITARSFYTQGMRRSDIVIHATGLTLFVAGLSSKDAVENLGALFVPIGTGASEKAFAAIQLFKANAIHCTPSYAIYFAEWIRRKTGQEPRELGIRKLFCGAEPGAGIPAIRAKIEAEWGTRVTEGLGNADMAPIIFSECPEQSGMHFNAQEYVLPEIINPETEEILPIEKGVMGELVYTSLERECVPLLRFRTRDRVTVLDTECCCGRTSFKLRCIGRTDDMLIVLGVNIFPSAVRDVVAGFYPETTGEIQILLDQPGPKVTPPLRVVAEANTQNPLALQQEIERKVKAVLTVPARVELVAPGTLPRFEMKAQLVKKMYESKAAVQ